MIYNEYKTKFYKDSTTGRDPVLEYINKLQEKEQIKIFKYIEFFILHLLKEK